MTHSHRSLIQILVHESELLSQQKSKKFVRLWQQRGSWKNLEETAREGIERIILMAFEEAASVNLKKQEESGFGHWRKGSLFYEVVECLATMLPAMVQKVDNVPDEMGDLCKKDMFGKGVEKCCLIFSSFLE